MKPAKANKPFERKGNLPLSLVRREVLSPEQYMALTSRQRDNIASIRVNAPVLGSSGFGAIEVEYQNAILK